jgi:ornithine cyclodeaminase/alanine dehydrogenase-like protein (mu-crystallin family)
VRRRKTHDRHLTVGALAYTDLSTLARVSKLNERSAANNSGTGVNIIGEQKCHPPRHSTLFPARVKRVIDDNRKQVFDAVEAAYRLHTSGDTVNPDSYFLRYPDKPSARIIALPAHLGGAVQRSGIKWISSFLENRASNLARASAVLILNDATTGYPLACIEASLISATRTAASAALAAEHIFPNPFEGSLGVIGTGVIARTAIEWLFFRNWKFHKISLYDLDRKEAEHFSKWLRDQHNLEAYIQDRLEIPYPTLL